MERSKDSRTGEYGIARRHLLAGLAAAGTAGLSASPAAAGIARAPFGYNNLLVVDGIDPTREYRPQLALAIQTAAALSLFGTRPPVYPGSHDFWLAFPFPAQDEFNPAAANFSYPDYTTSGRKLRGIGDLRRMPGGVTPAELSGRLFTMLHESAHAWLVPDDMRVNLAAGAGTAPPLLLDELTAALTADRPLVHPALLARQNAHWSSLVNFASCMDASNWDRSPSEPGYMQWTQRDPAPTIVRPAGLPALPVTAVYSDLDLYLMGAKRADQCFPDTGGQFYWLEPKLSTGDPMQYHCGLFIAFSPTDYLYFGFYSHHGRLKVERSNGLQSAIVDIGPAYRPLRNEFESMMLRVVKQGGRYLFQACRGNNAASVLAAAFTGVRSPMMFDDIDNPGAAPTSGPFDRWQTIQAFDAPSEPAAIGVITKTWNPILAEAEFFTFEIRQGTTNRAVPLSSIEQATRPGQGLSDLPTDQLLRDIPKAGAYFRRHDFAMIMGVPYADKFDHWSSVDQAPKMIMRAPSGDFTFGISAKVRRSFVSPEAGGAVHNMTMLGIERSAHVSDVTPPDRTRNFWSPPGTTYKNAFIVVTNQANRIQASDFAALDTLRRYYDAALPAISGGLLRSDSTL